MLNNQGVKTQLAQSLLMRENASKQVTWQTHLSEIKNIKLDEYGWDFAYDFYFNNNRSPHPHLMKDKQR
jgi:hypothetical protein